MIKILLIVILFVQNLSAAENSNLYNRYSSKLDKEIIFKFGVPTNVLTIETSTYFTYRLNLYCSTTFRFRNHKLINAYSDLENNGECQKFYSKFIQ